jgi:hypothetical protein
MAGHFQPPTFFPNVPGNPAVPSTPPIAGPVGFGGTAVQPSPGTAPAASVPQGFGYRMAEHPPARNPAVSHPTAPQPGPAAQAPPPTALEDLMFEPSHPARVPPGVSSSSGNAEDTPMEDRSTHGAQAQLPSHAELVAQVAQLQAAIQAISATGLPRPARQPPKIETRKPEVWDGNMENHGAKLWVLRIKNYIRIIEEGWNQSGFALPEHTKINLAGQFLTGQPYERWVTTEQEIATNVSPSHVRTLNGLLAEFEKEYSPIDDREQRRRHFNNFRQTANMSAHDYIHGAQQAASNCHLQDAPSRLELKNHIETHLREPLKSRVISAHEPPSDFNKWCGWILGLDKEIKALAEHRARSRFGRGKLNKLEASGQHDDDDTSSILDADDSTDEGDLNAFQRRGQSNRGQNTSASKGGRSGSYVKKCYICNSTTHLRAKCPKKPAENDEGS